MSDHEHRCAAGEHDADRCISRGWCECWCGATMPTQGSEWDAPPTGKKCLLVDDLREQIRITRAIGGRQCCLHQDRLELLLDSYDEISALHTEALRENERARKVEADYVQFMKGVYEATVRALRAEQAAVPASPVPSEGEPRCANCGHAEKGHDGGGCFIPVEDSKGIYAACGCLWFCRPSVPASAPTGEAASGEVFDDPIVARRRAAAATEAPPSIEKLLRELAFYEREIVRLTGTDHIETAVARADAARAAVLAHVAAKDEEIAKWHGEAKRWFLEKQDALDNLLRLRAENEGLREDLLDFETADFNLRHQLAALREKYDELIMAVAKKHKGESRHETALRYIQQREDSSYTDGFSPAGGQP